MHTSVIITVSGKFARLQIVSQAIRNLRMAHETSLQIASKSVTHTSTIGSGSVVLLGPFAGLVASGHYGRYRT